MRNQRHYLTVKAKVISKNVFLSVTQDQQSCDVTWRYARSCFDIATLKGKNGDFEGKRTLLYEGKLHFFFYSSSFAYLIISNVSWACTLQMKLCKLLSWLELFKGWMVLSSQ